MSTQRTIPQLSANSITVLEKRYLLKDEAGRLTETPAELFERVARSIARPEKSKRTAWEKKFYQLMCSRRFLPNSPTLMNAGKQGGQLSACFVLPIEDDLEHIFDTLKNAAKIHQSGGGTGFSFSRLRPRGSRVRSSSGVASGPVSFMRIFDTATETIKQGGTRRGANMAILRVDHPDILEFINCKRDQSSILNFNISVGITDHFMNCLTHREKFGLKDPRTGKVVDHVDPAKIFDELVQAAWECGDPGLIFLDRLNFFNPTPKVGEMESTNPCGEQPLLPFESCNLGSLNLGLYLKEGHFDWKLFREDIWTSVRFLDNVIDVNVFPIDECRKITQANRKIGLGVMGFADLLLKLGLPYNSHEARGLGEKLMGFLDIQAKHASAALARERGAFKNFRGSLWEKLHYPKLRNATVSTVAPTGTISMIAVASSGIEPIFSGVFYRNVLSGKRLVDIHPAVEELLKRKDWSLENLNDQKLAEALGAAWTPAHAISVDDHVRMQAVFQRNSDSAVSKTINLPQSARPSDVWRAYRLAYASGCKGITVYRDQSRAAQVLEQPPTEETNSKFCAVC